MQNLDERGLVKREGSLLCKDVDGKGEVLLEEISLVVYLILAISRKFVRISLTSRLLMDPFYHVCCMHWLPISSLFLLLFSLSTHVFTSICVTDSLDWLFH